MDRHVDSGPLVVLDAGCGTGSTLEWLAGRGYRAVGFDRRPEGLVAILGSIPGVSVFQAEASLLPVASGVFDAALALDVLEHVDDRQALAELVRAVRPGAPLIIAVPALPFLWSYRDQAAGHLRRYTKRHLRLLLQHASLDIRQMRYYQFLLLPLVVMTRWLGRRNPAWRDREDLPPPSINKVLTAISRVDVSLGRFIPWPCGSSLVVVCRTSNHGRAVH